MKKEILSLLVMFIPMSLFSQMKITTFSADVKGLQTVNMFFEEHKTDIDSYNGKTITLADVIISMNYWGTLGSEGFFALCKEYVYKDDYDLSEQTIYLRKQGEPRKFVPISNEKAKTLKPWPGDKPFPFYMPCDFTISIGDDRGFKVVKFKRKINCNYIVLDLQ